MWISNTYEIIGVMNFRQRKTAPHDLPKYNHQILIHSEYPKGTYIWSISMVNVGKYTIHGSFGIFMNHHPDRQTSFTDNIINTHPRWNWSHSLIVSWSMAWGSKPLHSKREMTSSQKFGISGTVPGGWNFIEEVCWGLEGKKGVNGVKHWWNPKYCWWTKSCTTWDG